MKHFNEVEAAYMKMDDRARKLYRDIGKRYAANWPALEDPSSSSFDPLGHDLDNLIDLEPPSLVGKAVDG